MGRSIVFGLAARVVAADKQSDQVVTVPKEERKYDESLVVVGGDYDMRLEAYGAEDPTELINCK